MRVSTQFKLRQVFHVIASIDNLRQKDCDTYIVGMFPPPTPPFLAAKITVQNLRAPSENVFSVFVQLQLGWEGVLRCRSFFVCR